MKTFVCLLIFALFAVNVNVKSQDCTFYFPQKPGASLELTHYKSKDKVTGKTKTKIKEANGSSIKFSSEFFDEKGKLLNSGDYEVKCKNGEFVMDMSSFTNSMNLSAYKNMEVKIETEEMSLPAKLQPGQQLNNGEIRIKVSNQGFTILKMTVKIFNRKVEGFEDVTTPAGTFKCAKITYEVTTESIVNMHTKGVEFISQKLGVVRSESHDSKDKLLSFSLLSSFTE